MQNEDEGRVTVRLPRQTIEELNECARRQEHSTNQLVRLLIRRELQRCRELSDEDLATASH